MPQHLQPILPDRPVAGPAHDAAVAAMLPRVVRCACEDCGAHTNAVWTFRVAGSCPTCGSFRLAPLEGAELMHGARLVA